MKIMSSMNLSLSSSRMLATVLPRSFLAAPTMNPQSRGRPPTQNLTMMARSMKDSSFRRSGNQTLLIPPPQAVSAAPRLACPEEVPLLQVKNWGEPLFPPGGVMPPAPLQ